MSAEPQEAIVFEVLGTTPAPQGSKTPWGTEANPNTKPWRETVAAECARIMLEENRQQITGPVKVTAVCFFPRPKSHFRANGQLKPQAPRFKDSKPDLDKLQRALGDALSGVAFRDDAQIAWWDIVKQYATTHTPPGVNISIQPLWWA